MGENEQPSGGEWTAAAYWRQPIFEPTETGDPTEAGIFMAVGAALSSWETMEDEVANLFSVFGTDRENKITNHSFQIGRHMFGMMDSSSTRLKMLQVAASLYFGNWWEAKLVSRPYIKLLEAISHASHRRNEIAHGRVIRVQRHLDGASFKNSGFFLTSPQYNVNRNQPYYGGKWHSGDVLGPAGRSKYRYRMSDIAAFAQKFALLASKVRDLMMETSRDDSNLPKIVRRLMNEGKLNAPG